MPKTKNKVRADGRMRKIVDGKAFYGRSEREINRKILEFKERQEAGRTFSEIADEWWEETYDDLASQSVSVYRPALRRAVEHFGDMSVSDILPRDVAAFYRQLARAGYAQKTVATHRIVLNQILSLAVVSGDAQYNPCASVPLPKGLKKTTRSAASAEDEQKILRSSASWLFPVFALLSGLRKGEILALQWKDIDFEKNTISVTKSIEHVGDRPNVKPPKTEAGNRLVPLLVELRDRLVAQRGAPSDFIFSDDGKKPLTQRRFTTLYSHYCEETHITCTPHQLRHSYATIAVESDVQPRELQGILGHTCANFTMEKYAHYRERSVANVAEKLNARFSQK